MDLMAGVIVRLGGALAIAVGWAAWHLRRNPR